MAGRQDRDVNPRGKRPSRKRLTIIAIGLLLGVAAVVAFDLTLSATSSEPFCISCHEMEANAFAQLQKTTHFSNPSGMSASCADCHIPREFVPKLVRKAEAARELWGHFTGVIDSPEKYAAHTPAMKAREIARLKANDSRECRNCHDTARMFEALQSARAQKYHVAREMNHKTCIDCHAGIAHPENAGVADGDR